MSHNSLATFLSVRSISLNRGLKSVVFTVRVATSSSVWAWAITHSP